MQITKQSAFTNKLHTREVPVTYEQLNKWNNGELIQDAMPNLSKEDREFLLTGVTPEEWKNVFG